jgi:hypothetical protein
MVFKKKTRFQDSAESPPEPLHEPLITVESDDHVVLHSPFEAGPPGGGPVPLRPAGGVLRDKYGRYRTLTDQRARTTVLVNLAGILERSNEQTLPALYK